MRQSDGTEALRRVRTLRRSATTAERKMWGLLRSRGLAGAKFRRQVWLEPYIADFLCFERKLVIELDGGQHVERAGYDREREVWFATQGFQTLRFWNNEIDQNEAGVLDTILSALKDEMPSPSHAAHGPLPLPSGEGM